MFPKSKTFEKKHRQHKRQIEIAMAIEAISNILKKNHPGVYLKTEEVKILEFGCGDGFQTPYLNQMGSVVASDIKGCTSIKNKGVEFVECSIEKTPFGECSFDVIYSNHVVEHIEDADAAFNELIRIGKPACIYAFSVPTNLWLLLSIPAQYLSKLKSLFSLLSLRFFDSSKKSKKVQPAVTKYEQKNGKVSPGRILQLLIPSGHGTSINFIECYRNFRIKNWYRLFSDNGFSVIEMKPLLLYGPSEWPILSTQKPKFNLCSSVLFLMSKREF